MTDGGGTSKGIARACLKPTAGLESATLSDLRLEKGKATRDRLIAAARKLFGRHGYEATSIEAILKASRVKRGSLYHHFTTKEALFDAVLDSVVGGIAETTAEAARAAGADPVARLRAGCDAWLRMALDRSIQRIALLDAASVVGWTRWRELDAKYTLGRLRANMRRVRAFGSLPAAELDVLVHMLMAALSEAALLIASAEDPEAALATGRAAVKTFLDRLMRV